MEQWMKKITIDDVARELGVSKTTVSRAISGKGRIGAETRQRVLDYIEKHNYKPNVMAKGLAKNRTYNIGLVMPVDLMASDLPFFPKALKGISETAAAEEYDLILALVDSGDLSQLERVIDNQKVDGMILMRTLHEDRPAELLKRSGIPFVAIGMSDDPQVYQIDNDHVGACRELTSILLMKGLKRIAIVTGDMNFVINRKRIEGFCKAHEDLKLPYTESLIFTDVDTPIMVSRVTESILMHHVNCIIGTDDSLTVQIKEKLEEEDILIPEDMRLASFYDSQLLSGSKVGITSIRFDVEELGREACRVLLRRIHGTDVPKVTQLSYEVTLRESTK